MYYNSKNLEIIGYYESDYIEYLNRNHIFIYISNLKINTFSISNYEIKTQAQSNF